jgi:hypothetical protein
MNLDGILTQVSSDFGLQVALLALFLLTSSLVGGFGRVLFMAGTLMQFGRFFLLAGVGGGLFTAFS